MDVLLQVGGSMASLHEHIQAVSQHLLFGPDIDFKLAESSGARNDATLRDAGFNNLAVNVCKELVTLGPKARHAANPLVNGATHLTPQEFHDKMSQACSSLASSDVSSDDVVLLDARNVYETAIGHFRVPGVPLLDPQTRCFSDLPDWVDDHAQCLAGKTVLMYCTGGVRCERASAYLREKGPAFANVYQLKGGIQHYLEAFPDGGYFKGKNFVYDDRGAVGPEQGPGEVVGTCIGCSTQYDDYGPRCRCRSCRLLVLLCHNCQHLAHSSEGVLCTLCKSRQQQQHQKVQPNVHSQLSQTAGLWCSSHAGNSEANRQTEQSLQCSTNAGAWSTTYATCAKHHPAETSSGDSSSTTAVQNPANGSIDEDSNACKRKLKLLCIHGFRQTAKQFMVGAQYKLSTPQLVQP
eukprot:jgi/Chrzof1/8571/Cz03g15310.t1